MLNKTTQNKQKMSLVYDPEKPSSCVTEWVGTAFLHFFVVLLKILKSLNVLRQIL